MRERRNPVCSWTRPPWEEEEREREEEGVEERKEEEAPGEEWT